MCIASNGCHAEVVSVPTNLCAKVPDSVDFDHACFAVLGSIALQGVRLSQTNLGEAVLVEVSVATGSYTATQSVGLSTSSAGATIRYTLDGSVPSSSSPAYTVPIEISATTILRARTFEADRIPGPLATRS